MDELPIGEIARQAGVRTSALRYYESVGLLPAPRRVNGRRRYDADIIQRLTLIQLAQRAGFTIAEIQTLLNGFDTETPPAARWKALARQKLQQLDAQIAQAQQMKQLLQAGLECGCLRWEDCVIVDGLGCQRDETC
jgi:MerR family redox-sensitive transcriptional activator SoxR